MRAVYIAAPYVDAPHVRMVASHLERFGISDTSSWAHGARGPENLGALMPAQLQQIAADNDADIRRADAALVLAREGAGGEMFAEVRIALEWGKPVIWVGRRILSTYRRGVVIADDLDDAIIRLVRLLAPERVA